MDYAKHASLADTSELNFQTANRQCHSGPRVPAAERAEEREREGEEVEGMNAKSYEGENGLLAHGETEGVGVSVLGLDKRARFSLACSWFQGFAAFVYGSSTAVLSRPSSPGTECSTTITGYACQMNRPTTPVPCTVLSHSRALFTLDPWPLLRGQIYCLLEPPSLISRQPSSQSIYDKRSAAEQPALHPSS